ncbi:hypothetical protein N665_0395s0025 [Sinapis alba]|nr:hypothetical protein N665_0395s0025 [Sinapis alba]
MAAKEEDGNVKADGDPAKQRERDQLLEEIFSNHLLSPETSNEQGTSSNQLDVSSNVPVSSGEAVLEPSSSDIAKDETKSVPVSSGEAVSSLSVPSSSDLKNVEIKKVPITRGKKAPLPRPPTRMISPSGPSMADVVKMSLGSSSKENVVTKAPAVKNDPSLHEKSSSKENAVTKAPAVKNDPSLHEKSSSKENVVTKAPAVKNEPSLHEKSSPATKPSSSNASTEKSSNAIRKEKLGDSEYKLPDDEEVTNPIDYSSSDYDVIRYELQKSHDSKKLSKIDSSSSDHLKAKHVPYETHEAAQPKPSLQRQIVNTFPDVMNQQGYTRELDPRYSASSSNQPMHTRQSITTASSPGRRQPFSMAEAVIRSNEFVPHTRRNQQAMNPPHYSHHQVPSAQYGGNTTNSPYSPPNQNEGYNMPPPSAAAAFQQHGGRNMAHYGNIMTSPYSWPQHNDSYNNMPQLAYAYGSANLFGTWSDNPANFRFGYQGGFSRNHLPSIQQHQSVDSNVLPPSSRRSRQQQPSSDSFAAQNQQDDTSDDPSDQTQ